MGSVDLERNEGVAVITLNAPEKRNALSPEMAEQLIDAIETIDADVEVGAAIVRGAGDHFCAGADLGTIESAAEDPTSPEAYSATGSVYESFVRAGECAVPVIAAIEGAAVGAGVNLMMAADLRIVAESTRMFSGFQRLGIHPGGGHYVLLGRLASRETVAAMALFDQEIDGCRARELGLAWECVEDGTTSMRALELARNASADPELTRASLASFRLQLGPPVIPWPAAVQADRARQMWSLRRMSRG